MLHYTVLYATRVPCGLVLALSPEQASHRLYGLQVMEKGGLFKVTTELCFKAGEIIGFDKTPPPRLLQYLQCEQRSEERLEDTALEQHACAFPAGLSALQEIAYQAVLDQGFLTIKRYQALCGGVQRRRLQRLLKGLVDKKIFIREGATHRARYVLLRKEQCK
jgi:hypothetical protein